MVPARGPARRAVRADRGGCAVLLAGNRRWEGAAYSGGGDARGAVPDGCRQHAPVRAGPAGAGAPVPDRVLAVGAEGRAGGSAARRAVADRAGPGRSRAAARAQLLECLDRLPRNRRGDLGGGELPVGPALRTDHLGAHGRADADRRRGPSGAAAGDLTGPLRRAAVPALGRGRRERAHRSRRPAESPLALARDRHGCGPPLAAVARRRRRSAHAAMDQRRRAACGTRIRRHAGRRSGAHRRQLRGHLLPAPPVRRTAATRAATLPPCLPALCAFRAAPARRLGADPAALRGRGSRTGPRRRPGRALGARASARHRGCSARPGLAVRTDVRARSQPGQRGERRLRHRRAHQGLPSGQLPL